jgi:UDP-N-acetylglucosamine--N-acetylmuramyl-(pentapeptide) pyrophosphoryl-undecaprenol N-acetylglucosamine transferase
VPALAVAQALRAEGAEVSFIGGQRAEAELVPAAGFVLHPIVVRGLDRGNPWRAAGAAALAARAAVGARGLLGRLQVDAVLGGGGYVAGPVGLAAVTRRLPLVLTEADSHLGLTNRLLARAAHRVCLAFPIPGCEPPRFLVTGRPVPSPATDRAGAREELGLAEQDRLVMVFGGSLGARSINASAAEGLPGGPFRVLHLAGARDYPQLAGRDLGPGYDLREYMDSADFSRALLASDLVVARAGGSIFEVAAHGRPAILVPYPHATGDHQTLNARWMAEAGAATVIADGDLTPARLVSEVNGLLNDQRRLESMARASAGLAAPDAAQVVARTVMEAIGEAL